MDSRIVGGGMGVCFLLSNTSVCSIRSTVALEATFVYRISCVEAAREFFFCVRRSVRCCCSFRAII